MVKILFSILEASFYAQFLLKSEGKLLIRICKILNRLDSFISDLSLTFTTPSDSHTVDYAKFVDDLMKNPESMKYYLK